MAEEKKTTPPIPPAGGAAPAPEAKKEEKAAPAAAAEGAPKASPMQSPWIPVLAVMLITPILSFVVTENLMIPRVKKALGEIARIQQEGEQPAHGGPQPTESKAAKKEGGHGGGHGGAAKPEAPGVKFDNIVANLSGSMKSRFVKVSFSIEGDDDDFKAFIETNKTKVIDSALGILGALTVAELDEPGMKNIVRSDLIDGFNQALGKPMVKRLYFSEFVIQ